MVKFSNVFYTLIVGGKKELEAGNLFSIHETVHLIWFLWAKQQAYNTWNIQKKFLLSPWKKTKT